jgi:hypothetical protein
VPLLETLTRIELETVHFSSGTDPREALASPLQRPPREAVLASSSFGASPSSTCWEMATWFLPPSPARPWELGRWPKRCSCSCLTLLSLGGTQEREASLVLRARETSALGGMAAVGGGTQGEEEESVVRHTAADHRAPPSRSTGARRRCGSACQWASSRLRPRTRAASTRAAAGRASVGRPWWLLLWRRGRKREKYTERAPQVGSYPK